MGGSALALETKNKAAEGRIESNLGRPNQSIDLRTGQRNANYSRNAEGSSEGENAMKIGKPPASGGQSKIYKREKLFSGEQKGGKGGRAGSKRSGETGTGCRGTSSAGGSRSDYILFIIAAKGKERRTDRIEPCAAEERILECRRREV